MTFTARARAAWQNAAAHVLRLLTVGEEVDADTQALVEYWLEKGDQRLAYQTVITATLLNASMTLIGVLMARPELQAVMIGVHGLCVAMHLVYFLGLRRLRVDPRTHFFFSQVVFAFGYGYFAYVIMTTAHDTRAMLASSFITGFVVLSVMTCPYRGWVVGISAAVHWGAVALFCAGVAGSWNWIAANAFAAAGAAAFKIGLDARSHRAAIQDVKMRLKIAPRHVVRQAAGAGGDVEALFAPAPRWCVSVAVRRDIADAAAGGDLVALGDAMNRFHSECDVLLRQTASGGNYYADWSGGDLTVVLYAVESGDEPRVAREAVDFATRLIAARAVFADPHEALDVGLAAGEALVGIMGSPGARKVTALGDVPGRARRFLASGSILRRRLGERDRVVFGPDTADQLEASRLSGVYRLRTGEAMRDLQSDSLVYIDPAPRAEEVADVG